MPRRILGLDYGDARIGVAISDALGWTASPLETISRKNPIDLTQSIARLAEIAAGHDIDTIVLGYPKNMDNSEGESCRRVNVFKKRLTRALPNVCITLFDERLTTVRAAQIFAETDMRHECKQNVDKLAAAIILQGYLDMKNKTAKKEKIMDNDNMNFDTEFGEEVEIETIVMTDEEGNDIEYVIIDEFEDDGTSYLVMVKADDAEEDEAEAVIFKQVEASDEEYVYEEIDADEYNKLEDMLKARLAEFDIDIQ